MKLSLKRIRAEKRKRERALADNLERIKAYLIDRGAFKIVLFGSFAEVLEHPERRHGARRGTDLDILCVMPSSKTGREWMAQIYAETEREVDCDILAYTEEELEKTIPVSGFLRRALETGRVIYEKRPEG
jgi:predicted nucleotidyltransferase